MAYEIGPLVSAGGRANYGVQRFQPVMPDGARWENVAAASSQSKALVTAAEIQAAAGMANTGIGGATRVMEAGLAGNAQVLGEGARSEAGVRIAEENREATLNVTGTRGNRMAGIAPLVGGLASLYLGYRELNRLDKEQPTPFVMPARPAASGPKTKVPDAPPPPRN